MGVQGERSGQVAKNGNGSMGVTTTSFWKSWNDGDCIVFYAIWERDSIIGLGGWDIKTEDCFGFFCVWVGFKWATYSFCLEVQALVCSYLLFSYSSCYSAYCWRGLLPFGCFRKNTRIKFIGHQWWLLSLMLHGQDPECFCWLLCPWRTSLSSCRATLVWKWREW